MHSYIRNESSVLYTIISIDSNYNTVCHKMSKQITVPYQTMLPSPPGCTGAARTATMRDAEPTRGIPALVLQDCCGCGWWLLLGGAVAVTRRSPPPRASSDTDSVDVIVLPSRESSPSAAPFDSTVPEEEADTALLLSLMFDDGL